MHKKVDALHQEHTLLPESFPAAGWGAEGREGDGEEDL